jgi:hypothetical protein
LSRAFCFVTAKGRTEGTAQVQGPWIPGSRSSSRQAVNLPPVGSNGRVGPWRRGWLQQTAIARVKRPPHKDRGAGPALPGPPKLHQQTSDSVSDSSKEHKVSSSSSVCTKTPHFRPFGPETNRVWTAHRATGQHATAAIFASLYRRSAATPLPGTDAAICRVNGSALSA